MRSPHGTMDAPTGPLVAITCVYCGAGRGHTPWCPRPRAVPVNPSSRYYGPTVSGRLVGRTGAAIGAVMGLVLRAVPLRFLPKP